jgi:hypothetical protein
MAWKLNDATATISDGNRTFEYSGHREVEDRMEVSFSPSLSTPSSGDTGETLEMTLRYPGTPKIEVVLGEDDVRENTGTTRNRAPGLFPTFVPGIGGAMTQGTTVRTYRIREIEVAGTRLSLGPQNRPMREIRALRPEISRRNREDKEWIPEVR